MADPNPPVPPVVPPAPSAPDPPNAVPDPRWFYLSVIQYLVLALIGGLFAYFLVNGVLGSEGKNMERLANQEVARGVITYLVAVATVAIATMLVMTAIMRGGTDLDKRFAFGKEILTLLIGVLGTIIGFYYGSTTNGNDESRAPIEVAAVQITPDAQQAGKFNLSSTISGGTPPYTYSIKFSPNDVTPKVENEVSNDGEISHDFTVPADKVTTPIDFTIEVRDRNDKTFSYNKDNQEKINLKPSQPSPP